MKSARKQTRPEPRRAPRPLWAALAVAGIFGGAVAAWLWPEDRRPPASGPGVASEAEVLRRLGPLPTNHPAQLMNFGTELWQRGDTAGAIAVYAEARKLTPEDEEVRFALGRALAGAGRTVSDRYDIAAATPPFLLNSLGLLPV